LTNKIYLIDCPGVVHESTNKSEAELVLSGVVRMEKLSDPTAYIDRLLCILEPKVLCDFYDLEYKSTLMDVVLNTEDKEEDKKERSSDINKMEARFLDR